MTFLRYVDELQPLHVRALAYITEPGEQPAHPLHSTDAGSISLRERISDHGLTGASPSCRTVPTCPTSSSPTSPPGRSSSDRTTPMGQTTADEGVQQPGD